MDCKKIRYADKIFLKDLDKLVKNYISTNMFNGGIDLDILRAYCSLKEDKEYLVTDNCPSCGFLYIKHGDEKRYIQIKHKYIKK